MTPDMKSKLRQLLVSHESLKLYPYIDTTGNTTIGVGRCLTTRGISTTEALYLLDDDIIYFTSKLTSNLKCFADLDSNRQIALIDMVFNLGLNGFMAFHEMIEALEKKDYELAAKEMMTSKWAMQVGERAVCLANIIKTGDLA